MKELTLKRRSNTYLYRGYPGISSNFENGAKQLEAQLENGVAYKKKRVSWSPLSSAPPPGRLLDFDQWT